MFPAFCFYFSLKTFFLQMLFVFCKVPDLHLWYEALLSTSQIKKMQKKQCSSVLVPLLWGPDCFNQTECLILIFFFFLHFCEMMGWASTLCKVLKRWPRNVSLLMLKHWAKCLDMDEKGLLQTPPPPFIFKTKFDQIYKIKITILNAVWPINH